MSSELLRHDATMYGADAEVSPEGFAYERGSGAHSKEVQRAVFRRQLADPEWVAAYKLRDPHARIRHPHLFVEDKP
jgi:hypothetical protein